MDAAHQRQTEPGAAADGGACSFVGVLSSLLPPRQQLGVTRDKRYDSNAAVAICLQPGRIPRRLATDQDLAALAAIRSTERRCYAVGLMRVRRGSPHFTSPCDGAHYGYFAAQPVWRYAASLAGSAAICRSAYLLVERNR